MLPHLERDQLRRGALALDVSLTDSQVDTLSFYVERLLAWNQKLNLTAVTEPAAIVDKHLLDALALVPVFRDLGPAELLDVGTGPGLPAIVLATLLPSLRVTAVESSQKKATFVRTVSRELGLLIDVKTVRLEDLDPSLTWDLAVSRATFEPSEWVDRAQHLVRPDGLLVAMLSEHQTVPAAPPGFETRSLKAYLVGGVPRRLAVYARSAPKCSTWNHD